VKESTSWLRIWSPLCKSFTTTISYIPCLPVIFVVVSHTDHTLCALFRSYSNSYLGMGSMRNLYDQLSFYELSPNGISTLCQVYVGPTNTCCYRGECARADVCRGRYLRKDDVYPKDTTITFIWNIA
jgi:hypothetical protein